MSIFFERILQISENKGFKNITDFAKNGLNWDSSEKINRLKRENNKPSIDILIEISNKFDDINLHWVITGKGEMIKDKSDSILNEPQESYGSKKEIELLKKELQFCEKQASFYERQAEEYKKQLDICRAENISKKANR